MKGFAISLVSRFLLVASVLAEATENRTCVDKLYDIFVAESAVTDEREPRTYVLCPDTIYKVTESFDSAVDSAGSPLVLGRSNIHVLCGKDGKSENNCKLQGGHVQAHLFDRFSVGSAINNVVLQGITFSDSVTHSVLAEHPGQMLILDCRFEVRSLQRDIFSGLRALSDQPFVEPRKIEDSRSFYLKYGTVRKRCKTLGRLLKISHRPNDRALSVPSSSKTRSSS